MVKVLERSRNGLERELGVEGAEPVIGVEAVCPRRDEVRDLVPVGEQDEGLRRLPGILQLPPGLDEDLGVKALAPAKIDGHRAIGCPLEESARLDVSAGGGIPLTGQQNGNARNARKPHGCVEELQVRIGRARARNYDRCRRRWGRARSLKAAARAQCCLDIDGVRLRHRHDPNLLLSDHWHRVNWLILVPPAGLLIALDLGNDGWLKILLERNLEELHRGQLIRSGKTASRKEEDGLHQSVLTRVVGINRAQRQGNSDAEGLLAEDPVGAQRPSAFCTSALQPPSPKLILFTFTFTFICPPGNETHMWKLTFSCCTQVKSGKRNLS